MIDVAWEKKYSNTKKITDIVKKEKKYLKNLNNEFEQVLEKN